MKYEFTRPIGELCNELTGLMEKWMLTEAKLVESHLNVALSRHLEIPLSEVTVFKLITDDHEFSMAIDHSSDDRIFKVDKQTILTFRQNGTTLEAIHEDQEETRD